MNVDIGHPRIAIKLLGGFGAAVNDEAVTLSVPAQRLLAFVALEPIGAHRSHLAQALWPRSTPPRAAASLRSALWQVRRSPAAPALESAGPRLWLRENVSVDIRSATSRTREILTGVETDGDPPHPGPLGAVMHDLRLDLLPGWDDEWVNRERERWDLARLRALEQIAGNLLARRRYPDAQRAAGEVVTLHPTRENAHRLIVEIHLAEGDPAAALNHYRHYRALLLAERGIAPSALMERLVAPLLHRTAHGAGPSPALRNRHVVSHPGTSRAELPGKAAIERAEVVFRLLDANGDGRVEAHDFEMMSKRVIEAAPGSSEADKAAMRTAFDRYWTTLSIEMNDGQDGEISLYEFTSCILSPERFEATIAEYAEALATLGDPDGDGLVERPRIMGLLGAIGFDRASIDALVDALGAPDSDQVSARDWANAIVEYCRPERSGIAADQLVPHG